MSFKPLTVTRGHRRPKSGIAMTCIKSRGKAKAFLLIGEDVLGHMDWKFGDRVDAAIGEDKHAGQLRLTAGDMLALQSQNRFNKTAKVVVSALADDQSHSVESCAYKIANGAIYITLPEWANGAKGQ